MNKNKCENNFGIFEPVNVNGSTGVMCEFKEKSKKNPLKYWKLL